MELTEVMGMRVGERKSLRANGRYRVGQVLHDDNPYVDEVLRVVEAGRIVFWDRDRIDDEGEFDRRPGEVTTDVVVERVERSQAGQAAVDAFRARYGAPVRAAGGELRVNTCRGEDDFFRHVGEVRPLAADRFQRRPALPALREEPVSGFGDDQGDRVCALPPDGWYECAAMCSPATSECYFFRLAGGAVTELVPANALNARYGLHWSQLHEAEGRFRSEHGA